MPYLLPRVFKEGFVGPACAISQQYKVFSPVNLDEIKIDFYIYFRPFECEVCKKTFALRGNLLFHQRSHNKGSTAERLFKCDYHDCEKDFICKGHLISHQRSHTQEKRFICSVATCQKKFVEKGNLLRHTKKQHPEIAMQVIRKANSVKSHLLQPQHIQDKQCVIG